MSQFQVQVLPIARIEQHPNADAIELAVVGEYRSVVRKGQFHAGDLVAYIPESAVVLEPVLVELGLVGKLAGSHHDRVKAVRLRGELSQGICFPARAGWIAGQDVAEELGITKYAPPIPTHLAGQVDNVGTQFTIHYDVENWKMYPDVVQDGESVVYTEKVHGTWCCVGVLAEPAGEHGDVVVCSKGLGARGLVFKDVPENEHNLYMRVARQSCIPYRIREAFRPLLPVFVLGEIYGVQDLRYGVSTAEPGFCVFDVHVGLQATGRFLDDAELEQACARLGLPRVPVLWRGPHDRETMLRFTDGHEGVSGRALHVREGVVVRPLVERKDPRLPIGGRVQLKSVSADYLLRRGTKDAEPTEFD